jgi:hypothetical protein
MARNDARDAEIFTLRCAGWSAAQLGVKYGLTTGRIFEILMKERGKIPPVDRDATRVELNEQLNHVRRTLQEVLDAGPGEDVKTYEGEVVHTQPDYGAVIYAARALAAVQARQAKLLGVDAPEQLEATTTVRYEMVGIDPDDI